MASSYLKENFFNQKFDENCEVSTSARTGVFTAKKSGLSGNFRKYGNLKSCFTITNVHPRLYNLLQFWIVEIIEPWVIQPGSENPVIRIYPRRNYKLT